LALGCPTADSGGEGAGGGAFHPSVVVALSGMPQLSLLSVIVGSLACSTLVKVQPSFVSTVAVLDLVIGGGWFFGVFLVEFAYNLWGVFEVFGQVPGLIRIVETGPLDLILYLAPVLL